ncbi:MAG: DUF3782 domain-containing protein, partial [Magnetococcales bacterium]|nr:DUF3782 domain-containing protein [Magnetococcales bacterium]
SECKEFFPEFANKRVIGAMAGIVVNENADLFAMRKGLFVILQTGEIVKLINKPSFVPKSW